MKICCRCKLELDNINFGKNKSAKDGFNPECKSCIKERINLPENKEKRIKYRKTKQFLLKNRIRCRKYYNNPVKKQRILERNSKWYKTYTRNLDKCREYSKKYNKENPIIKYCHGILHYYIRKGLIKKPDICEICGSNYRLIAHHTDYSKPLTVRWLCSKCHVNLHKNNISLT